MARSNRMPLLAAFLGAMLAAPAVLAQHHDMHGMMDADGDAGV